MSGYEIRRYAPSDEPEVLGLMGRALGWRDEDPNAELFRWKHRDSPFGPSPAWVAVEADRIIGFRTFMRWEFEEDGRIVRAVRAVDTATDPAHQGRGIFKSLTLYALDELRDDGVAFVFNTPNDQSRPGYLKMGWVDAGRIPTVFRPRSPLSVVKMLSSRVPAELWSTSTRAGIEAAPLLRQPVVAGLLKSVDRGRGLRTFRTPAYLGWRYGLKPLHYRVMLTGKAVEDGLVVFRVRRRGACLEAAVCEALLPRGGQGIMGRLLRASGADYAIGLGSVAGSVPLLGQGPLLTMRSLRDGAMAAPFAGDALSLGDVELF